KEIKDTVSKATENYKAGSTYNYYAHNNTGSAPQPKKTTASNNYNYYAQKNTRYSSQNNTGRKTMYASQGQNYAAYASKNSAFTPTPFMTKKPGKAGGIVEIVFGSIGMFFTGIWGMVVGILTAAVGSSVGFTLGGVIALIGFLAFTGLMVKGISDVSLVNEFTKYAKVAGDRTYITYEDIAKVFGQSVKKVKSKIKKFIKKGFFSYIMIDNEDTTLMFNKEVYDQYVQSVYAQKEKELQKAKEERENDKLNKGPEIIKEGTAYIKKVREINDIIPDTQEMSNKLYKLEEIMNRIFEKVKEDPQSADELRKFMNYYLPTTTKLLDAYVDLDKQSVQGENIIQAKAQIEDAMDTINVAFENLLDSMFQDMAWDISSDISVMKTMMAQDGLTEDALKKSASQNVSATSSGSASTTGMAQASAAATATATASAVATDSDTDKDRIKLQF
nr:5-bromo-4-chloroindolyl phosphate hydrolysis family protein [Butyrivibrio sp.]